MPSRGESGGGGGSFLHLRDMRDRNVPRGKGQHWAGGFEALAYVNVCLGQRDFT